VTCKSAYWCVPDALSSRAGRFGSGARRLGFATARAEVHVEDKGTEGRVTADANLIVADLIA
jgi:carbon monoxide dehydrogenase subunit G